MKLVLETADGFDTLADDGGADGVLVGVLPGDDITLNHVRGSIGEARLQAADLAARPLDDLHVALGVGTGGPKTDDGEAASGETAGGHWLALIGRDQLRAHLARFHAAGFAITQLVPAALLLPEGGAVSAPLGDRLLLRTAGFAACVEANLAAALLDGEVRQLAAFRPAWPQPIVLDLLQGEFAPRRRWWRERPFRLTAAVLGLWIGLALVLPPFLAGQRASALAEARDRETIELAATVLGERPTSASAAAEALFAARQTAEARLLAPRLAFVAGAINAAPGATLERLALRPDGRLELQAGGATGPVDRFASYLRSGPFAVAQQGSGFVLGERRRGTASGAPGAPAAAATLRLAAARQDAAMLEGMASAAGRPAALATGSSATERLAAAFPDSEVATQQAGHQITIHAANAAVLLPLLVALERDGARIEAADIAPNADRTVRATLAFA